MKLVWLTDIHLNFLDQLARERFYQTLRRQGDVLLISGDIAEAPSVAILLKEMASHIQQPIFFVLGNHDYYQGRIESIRQQMILLSQQETHLHWLPALGVVQLEADLLLVGQDGWADGRLGNYQDSPVMHCDQHLIVELFEQKRLGKSTLLRKMQQLADRDAKQLSESLQQAVNCNPQKIIILTHVPPFKEACWYQGKISNDDFLPFYSSQATGEVLMQFSLAYPHIEFLVLCGHTHHFCHYQPLENLTVLVGEAEYSHPAICEILYTNLLFAH